MHDPVSKDLIAKLEKYTGCRERDLIGCRRYVRQLSRDLPTFDSIWLDALVQARRLTPFQADCITSGQEESLLVGDYQLVSQLMQDRVHRRFLGRHAGTGATVLIEQHACPEGRREEVHVELTRLQQALQRIPAGFHVPAPLDYRIKGDLLFVVYRFERGLTVRELLVRRGRFPEDLVRVFTSHLMAGITALHEMGIGHGDLRANNVLVNRSGALVLLNAGLRHILTPQWTVQTELPFESYDTFAPEVVRSGQWSLSADEYSAGCLLWQMACGRPPLHSADSLLKLKVHLTRSIPDVREYAPDVDPATAEIIERLTRRNPAERRIHPDDFAGERRSRLSIRTDIRRFTGRTAPPLPMPSKPLRVPGVPGKLVAGVAIAAGLGLAGYGVGSFWNNEDPAAAIANVSESEPDTNNVDVEDATTETDTELVAAQPASLKKGPLEIPAPDGNGTVVLESGKRYVASDLIVRGSVQVRTTSDEAAVVEIRDQGWRIWADEVQLQNVSIAYQTPPKNSTAENPAALVVCQSRTFSAERCLWLPFEGGLTGSEAANQTRCLAWRPITQSASAESSLRLQDCIFHPAGSSVMLGGLSDRIILNNCLKTSGGDFLELSQSAFATGPLQLTCEHLTLRSADSLIHVHCPARQPEPEMLYQIQATNSVLNFSKNGSLLKLTGSENPAARVLELSVAGQILLINPDRPVAAWINSVSGQRETIRVRGQIEGVLPQAMTFAGDRTQAAAASELKDYRGPRWNSVAPGIRAARLPESDAGLIR